MNKLGEHRKKWKVQRALGVELPGLGKPGALEKRNFPPGQHGPTAKRKKPSNYALQLREKQKLLFNYGLREEQLRRYLRMAQSGKASDWMETLIGLLERRIDNTIFRLGFARSVAAARQLVSHGHVMVDGRRQTISSMVLRVGARISLSPKAAEMEATKVSRSSPRLIMPSYLMLETVEQREEGVIISTPTAEHVPFEFNRTLVAEYYAKRGV